MGVQIRSCSNCRHFPENAPNKPWSFCGSDEDHVCNKWKSHRGRKTGYKPDPGSKKPGVKEFEDRTLLRRVVTLSFTEKDILKAGGYQKVKEYLEAIFYKLIKGL